MRTSSRILILAAAAALAAGVAAAHEVDLDAGLTSEQRDKVRAIVERHRAEGLADAAQHARDARREARRLMRNPATTETELREAWRRASNAGEQTAVLRQKMRAEILSVLTPEQREAMENRSFRRHARSRRIL
jgi:Spy/CpxP family protein refolding chaperone